MSIGPYEVISELGRGGMGVVYKARDPRNGQFVAVKLLTGMGAVNPRGRMGLVREARITSQLRHPHIVRIHDIGQHKGSLFLVMEYLEGSSVDRIVKLRPAVHLRNRLSVMLQLCSGLGYAHARNVLHRDIKPANMFMLKSGPLKIVDFGLAKLSEIAGQSATKDTNTGFAGTLVYMSPEQLNGASADVRSDLWSVGVTFYELLTYTLPFSGASLAALIKSVENDAVPPLESSLPLRSELTHILERALAKDRNARYPTAEAFSHDLQAILVTLDAEQAAQQARHVDVDIPQPEPGDLQEDSYPQLELGLVHRTGGKVRFRTTKFTESGWRERIKQSLGRADLRALALLGFLWSAAIFMCCLLRHRTVDAFALEVTGGFIAIATSLFGLLAFAVSRANVTIRRKCQSCPRHMVLVTEWTRFVTSNTEIGWGLSDCIAALQDGCYEDAAKLLSVHGAENAAVYAVIRYNLESWECRKCSDQSAILIVEEKINSRWYRRDLYHESYKYAAADSAPALGVVPHPPVNEAAKKDGGPSGVLVRCPACRWEPLKEDTWSCTCGNRWNTFATGGVCPTCSLRWTVTICLSCRQASPHSDWYKG
jgi:protein kinase-like protein